MGELGFTARGAGSFVKYMTEELRFFCEGDPPAIPFHWVISKGKLVVLVGENAAGKSFVRRLVSAMCRDVKIEAIPISMEARSGGSMMYGPARAMVYGDEGHFATGVNTSNLVQTGIRTCNGRTESHVIFWDEPDLGLSDNAAAGAGAAIREFASNASQHTRAIFVATHSRYLVRELLPIKPHYLHLGLGDSAPATLEEWTERPVTPVDLEELQKAGHARFKAIQKILEGLKKKR
jgi:hypothetical protein